MPDELHRPRAITFDFNGRLLVPDPEVEAVLAYDRRGFYKDRIQLAPAGGATAVTDIAASRLGTLHLKDGGASGVLLRLQPRSLQTRKLQPRFSNGEPFVFENGPRVDAQGRVWIESRSPDSTMTGRFFLQFRRGPCPVSFLGLARFTCTRTDAFWSWMTAVRQFTA